MKKQNQEQNTILITNKTKLQKSKNMSKIFKISTISLITAGVVTAIVLPLFSGDGLALSDNVTFISNRNVVFDGSFNQSTNDGVEQYNAKFRANPASGSIQSKPEIISPTFSWDEGDGNAFYPYFDSAINRGSRTIISASYNMALTTMKYALENPYINFIVLDDTRPAATASNAFSVDFKSQEAGFFAGVAAALNATFKSQTQIANYAPLIGTWGGKVYSTVYSWLSGYEQGMNWYNYAILGYNNVVGNNSVLVEVDNFLDLIRTDVTAFINSTEVSGTGSLEYAATSNNNQKLNSLNLKQRGVGTVFHNASQISLSSGTRTTTPQFYQNYQASIDATSYIGFDWYSGTFNTPDDAAALMADKLYNLKASAVFPVAGGQNLYSLNKNMYTIGVDSDTYANFIKEDPNSQVAEYILGSAVKNLKEAAELTLWAGDRFAFGFRNEKKSIGTKVMNGNVEYIWTHEDENMYNLLKTDISQEVDLIDENENVIDTTYGWSTPSQSIPGTQLQGTSLNGGSSLVYSDTQKNSLLLDAYDWFVNGIPSSNLDGISGIGITNIPSNPKEFVEAALGANSFTIDANGNEWDQAGSGISKIVGAEWSSPTFTTRASDEPYVVPLILYSGIFPSWIPRYTNPL